MLIYKASAGSGKTYKLSKTYIDLLLGSKSSNPYRHILAVTFTNKATAEMKSRILKDLAEKGKSDPASRRMLISILHDYSALSVSTIDRFFQHTLKAFSREIGQFADYQIELDRESLIVETMDRILDGLSPGDKTLIDWIQTTVADTLNKGDKPSIENSLYDIGALLKNEEHRMLVEKLGIDELKQYSKKNLTRLKNECQKIIHNFEEGVKARGKIFVPNTKIEFGVRELNKNPELKEFKEDNYQKYCTALIINKLIFSLGLAGEFYKEFDKLLKEKNVLCLDESNTILKQIIAGSDAPFVYEKLGVRYEHFLLDEFQDTSGVQWDNFLPLLDESDSKGFENLIVGDVKQSIYRWRGSEWKLLGEEVKRHFPNAEETTLDRNWRSAKTIVEFNNALFVSLASTLGLEQIYNPEDVQQLPQKSFTGCVKIDFTTDQEAAILDSIEEVRSNGAEWKDIAILVRNNSDGSALAQLLISQNYPVISDESLKLKSSLIISRLCALLKAIDKPQDTINQFLIKELEIISPTSYHSLVDLCEDILRSLKSTYSNEFEGETLFIQAFMDEVQSYSSRNGNNLASFLEYWDGKDPSIASPEDANSIRILTIHKSKGLQFPHVIFPYAEKVKIFKPSIKWCALQGQGALDGCYPVLLSSKSNDTFFAKDYENERQAQLIDNINVFYVALTRAEYSLHIIAKKSNPKTISDFSQLLYNHIGNLDSVRYGKPFNFAEKAKTEKEIPLDFSSKYESIPIDNRLATSTDVWEFFAGEEVENYENSPRLRGVVLHDILSQIDNAQQIDDAVEAAYRDGQITAPQAADTRELLHKRISAHSDWFPEDGAQVFKEQSIIDSYGKEYRPDRVVVTPTGVIIIDYKFGEEDPKYLSQVRRYAELYKNLGYQIRDVAIWYVSSDKIVL